MNKFERKRTLNLHAVSEAITKPEPPDIKLFEVYGKGISFTFNHSNDGVSVHTVGCSQHNDLHEAVVLPKFNVQVLPHTSIMMEDFSHNHTDVQKAQPLQGIFVPRGISILYEKDYMNPWAPL
jgi:hypothetical protein